MITQTMLEDRIEHLKFLLKLSEDANEDTLKMSLDHVHARGLFSLVISNYKILDKQVLTRVFIARKTIEFGDIALHSHKYSLAITPIQGIFKQITATEVSITDTSFDGPKIIIPVHSYSSGISGKPEFTYAGTRKIIMSEFFVPNSSTIYMSKEEVHTVQVTEGTIWVIQETYSESTQNIVLGPIFSTSDLYEKCDYNFILDMKMKFELAVKRLLKSYESR